MSLFQDITVEGRTLVAAPYSVEVSSISIWRSLRERVRTFGPTVFPARMWHFPTRWRPIRAGTWSWPVYLREHSLSEEGHSRAAAEVRISSSRSFHPREFTSGRRDSAIPTYNM